MQQLQTLEEKMFHERQQQIKLVRKLLALKPSQRGLVNRWNAGTVLEGPKGNPNGVEGVDHIGGLTWEDVPTMLLECKPAEGQRSIKFDLSVEQLAERENMRAKAFTKWERSHFKAMVDAVEAYGVHPEGAGEDITIEGIKGVLKKNSPAEGSIADVRKKYRRRTLEEVSESTNKPMEEVEQYYDTFVKRYRELEAGDRIHERAVKGLKKVYREASVYSVIRDKVEILGGKVIYYSSTRGKTYSEDNDNALLFFMYKYGYGNWDEIHKAIRNCRLFQFDWVFKSKRPDELARRGDTVVRFCEKEVEKSRKMGGGIDNGSRIREPLWADNLIVPIMTADEYLETLVKWKITSAADRARRDQEEQELKEKMEKEEKKEKEEREEREENNGGLENGSEKVGGSKNNDVQQGVGGSSSSSSSSNTVIKPDLSSAYKTQGRQVPVPPPPSGFSLVEAKHFLRLSVSTNKVR